MEALPDEVLCHILGRITSASDRNALALACKRCYNVERCQRRVLRTGCGLHPVDEALVSLCRRFPNLTTVEISYSGWMSSQGRQIDDQGLALLSENCPLLSKLSLSFCCFVTDAGLGNLTKSKRLQSLILNFMPRITGIGLLSLVTCCSGMKALELNRCMYVYSVGWLEFLGTQGNLEELLIRNCRGVAEEDLAKLGLGWRTLRKLVFEVDGSNYRFLRAYGNASADQEVDVNCHSLELLILTNCVVTSGRGLSSVLPRCKSLVELQLNMCLGLRDEQLLSIAENCTQMKSLTLRLSSKTETSTVLTNASLTALATHCVFLERAIICIGDGLYSITVAGIVSFIQGCSFLKELVLDRVHCFNNVGMEAVCSSQSLEFLELIQCQQVGDQGISGLANSNVKRLKLCRCLGITNAAFTGLADNQTLDVLDVEDCPSITKESVKGAANNVYYKQDLSWIF